MKTYLVEVLTNQFFIIFITAAIGAAIGKIKIKSFSLGSAAGIFAGIFVGWAITAWTKSVPETDSVYSLVSGIANGSTPVVAQAFNMFFLLLFICSVGLSVGSKIKGVLNLQGLKLVLIGVIIPLMCMALTWGCLKIAPSLMGANYNGYEISGMYSGAMTNTAALGTSMEVVTNIGVPAVQERYAALDDESKVRALEMLGTEDTTPTEGLSPEQAGAFLGKAKSHISTGYAISFPVGTVVIILAMTLMSVFTKKGAATEVKLQGKPKGGAPAANGGKPKPLFFNAIVFGIVMVVGMLLGNIKIPLGGSVTFSLSSVGGVLISALVFSNISHIGPLDMTLDPRALGFMREFCLLFFMSVVGLLYGYDVIHAFAGAGVVIALMAIVVEIVPVIIALLIGRFLLKMNWGLLSGAICGGCTSTVGLAAAITTMENDEPIVGYGISQPFAILVNVILISLFHSFFFI